MSDPDIGSLWVDPATGLRYVMTNCADEPYMCYDTSGWQSPPDEASTWSGWALSASDFKRGVPVIKRLKRVGRE
jgi:hypothetical protein